MQVDKNAENIFHSKEVISQTPFELDERIRNEKFEA